MEILTETENKIAHGISQGFIEKELADKLCVSTHTIHAHARNIRKKLNARNIADIIRMYILSLENPRLIMRALFFAVLQVGIILADADIDLRKTSSKTARARRGKTKTKTVDYYV